MTSVAEEKKVRARQLAGLLYQGELEDAARLVLEPPSFLVEQSLRARVLRLYAEELEQELRQGHEIEEVMLGLGFVPGEFGDIRRLEEEEQS